MPPDNYTAKLIVVNLDSSSFSLDAEAIFSSGGIFLSEPCPVAANQSLFVDFGNGVRHQVAKSQDAQDGSSGIYFYLVDNE